MALALKQPKQEDVWKEFMIKPEIKPAFQTVAKANEFGQNVKSYSPHLKRLV